MSLRTNKVLVDLTLGFPSTSVLANELTPYHNKNIKIISYKLSTNFLL